MKYLLLVLLASGCYASWGAYPAAPYNYRDDVYCWHRNVDNKWEVQGLASTCPGGAEYRWSPPAQ